MGVGRHDNVSQSFFFFLLLWMTNKKKAAPDILNIQFSEQTLQFSHLCPRTQNRNLKCHSLFGTLCYSNLNRTGLPAHQTERSEWCWSLKSLLFRALTLIERECTSTGQNWAEWSTPSKHFSGSPFQHFFLSKQKNILQLLQFTQ